jgi:2-dehydro-3-deoxygalactonokinase
MGWAEGFIAVDWGTTNRRAYLLDAQGVLQDEMEDGVGTLSVERGRFPDSVATILQRLGDLPMLLAGMIGSNRGWVEAPYVSSPASLADLADRLVWVEPGRVAIVPGVSFDSDGQADVMRGEEVQVLGAHADGLIGPDCLVCHPGTHNKWIRLEQGRIARFRTVMTGETFNLLREHSILADLLDGQARPGAAFSAGVRHGLEHDDLLAELFSVRARFLLGKQPLETACDYTSGLLIGSDLRIGLRDSGADEVVAMGRPELTSLYAAALAEAGRPVREIDGETAFLGGAKRLAELMR